MSSSGFLPKSSELNLRERRKNFDGDQLSDTDDNELHEKNDEKLVETHGAELKKRKIAKFANMGGIAAITLLSFYVRFMKIDASDIVVWDEAHFGKFGSYYIKHEFYHDVHPPLGKMLIALSEYLAGFDGNFDFSSGDPYPNGVNFKFMRQFNATFGALCAPIMLLSAQNLGFSTLCSYLLGLMVALELSFISLSKFILLDSMLLFFTATTFHCITEVHKLRGKQFTKKWSLWMLLLGISIGCVCSVKWVGLFVTVIAGVYTVADLLSYHYDKNMGRLRYYKHWFIRIIDLIVIPFMIYLFCFKIHFTILSRSGTGDAATNTLFQVNLDGNNIEVGPRDVAYGSELTIRSHGLSPNLLHSHVQLYPLGSGQHQVTGYGHSDDNNRWVVKFSRESGLSLDNSTILDSKHLLLRDNSEIRLVHKNTQANLHSHEIPAHVSKNSYEVSGYGDEVIGDTKDDWVVEIVEQLDSSNSSLPQEDPSVLHPISTSFRLRHKELGCYLATTGLAYPAWGFKQAEIVCKHSWTKRDKSTWWNVEDHWNPAMEKTEGYIPPKSKFWADFVLINFAMASSNNALVPDEDKYDSLASEAWEWPILHVGLRMCGWGHHTVKYFLMGSPFQTWLSTGSLVAFVFIILRLAYKWRRQSVLVTSDFLSKVGMQGILPFLAWLLHYLPFVAMGRVTYVHHYVPALYFALLVLGFVLETCVPKRFYLNYIIYALLYAGCIYIYNLFSPIAQGMQGSAIDFRYLQWFNTWNIAL
ncbi:dolichyl-phosphate-mannose-protein mannosyltransferase PMT6 [Lachancea thermotolerans CBS 6340]|uniref:Dolichyl-phosphate-mannose--protein mannosyltransferase n=1 Tax=Lachancea thermotolerans (strain ATCC 56472 / CBS 6340 / NRRL Y-8284) TaxID=559295 RepID=C5DCB3_LACTC|nr:KLTH0B01650p [Lachancea thermotolerans CBS 6340]CAR21424.1 KLTH0B01650p [Lachancea thermotolerans CBS 6340]